MDVACDGEEEYDTSAMRERPEFDGGVTPPSDTGGAECVAAAWSIASRASIGGYCYIPSSVMRARYNGHSAHKMMAGEGKAGK